MRINVYNEELTGETEVVTKHVPETGNTYYGARVFMASPPELHHTENDDDRSAITFWFGKQDECSAFLAAYRGVVLT